MTEPHEDDNPGIGIRRWGDACFHPVEEEVPEGYIVDNILIPRDEVMEVLNIASGQVCRRTASRPPENSGA